jgi:23S rRNA pseudouridine2605 synthase
MDGRVRLNGIVVQLGQKADPEQDRVEVDGHLIREGDRPPLLYLLLNKPAGVVSTCDDPQQRSTVLDLLPPMLSQGQGLHPVGRLDSDSTGALLLTNDGDLTQWLTHPRHHIPKTYEVWVVGTPSPTVLHQWQEGVILDGRKTMPAQVSMLKRTPSRTLLRVILREGRNRQIRRVAEQLGYPVIQLHRSAIGSISLHSPGKPPLAPGQYRLLEDFEIRTLKRDIDGPSVRVPAQMKEQGV